jgi:hypothetical protein
MEKLEKKLKDFQEFLRKKKKEAVGLSAIPQFQHTQGSLGNPIEDPTLDKNMSGKFSIYQR